MLESQLLARPLRFRRAVRVADHADIGRLQASLLRQLLSKRLRLLELVGSGHQRQLAGETRLVAWLAGWKKHYIRNQYHTIPTNSLPCVTCQDVIVMTTRNARQGAAEIAEQTRSMADRIKSKRSQPSPVYLAFIHSHFLLLRSLN